MTATSSCQEPTAAAGSGDGGAHGKLAAVGAALDDGEGQALVYGAHGVLVARVEADGGDHVRRLLAADLDDDGLGGAAAALKTGGAADLHLTRDVISSKDILCMVEWQAPETSLVQQLCRLSAASFRVTGWGMPQRIERGVGLPTCWRQGVLCQLCIL